MESLDWIAVLALVVGGGALGLEIRRWVESGPRLRLNVMADAVMAPEDDGKPKAALWVTNRGSAPTTITHMVVFTYPSRWGRFRRRPDMQGIIPDAKTNVELGVNKQWMGLLYYDAKLTEARRQGKLYVGVIASHASGPYLTRIPAEKWTPKGP